MKNLKLLSAALTTSILLAPCSVFAGPTGDEAGTSQKEQRSTEKRTTPKNRATPENPNFLTIDSLLEPSETPKNPSCSEPITKRTRYDSHTLAATASPLSHPETINDWLVNDILPKVSSCPELCRYALALNAVKDPSNGKYNLTPEMYEFLLIRAANMFFENEIEIPIHILKLIPASELQTLRSFPFPRNLLSKQTFDNVLLGHVFDRPLGWQPEIDSLPHRIEVDDFLLRHPANQIFFDRLHKLKLTGLYNKEISDTKIYVKALRIWFMEGYKQGVFSLPQWIIDLKHREDEENARLAPTVDFRTLWSFGLSHINP